MRQEKIFELLGNNSSRYHSCILTTFAFDFSFFEVVAMRALKSAGIRNVLVLQDEGMQQALMETAAMFAFTRNTNYGLFPIKAKGVFHPKMIFCTGKTEGFLAIGSGNLTNGGHGSNDELWSVFHFKNIESPNAKLFSQIWQYIQLLSKDLKGIANEKLNWITQYSPWISALPESPPNEEIALKNGELIRLLPLREGADGISQITNFLKEEQVIEIIVISPYFEKDGHLLSQLKTTFQNTPVSIIMDLEYDALPYGLPHKANFKFYDWTRCKQKEEKDKSRLHAKLIVFRLEGGGEVLLQGSSNATSAAIGTKYRKAINHELNLLIKRKTSNILKELDISLPPEAQIELGSLKPKKSLDLSDTIFETNKIIAIKVVELDFAKLTLFSTGNFAEASFLRLYDRMGFPLDTIDIAACRESVTMQLNEGFTTPFFAAWLNKEKDRISNFQLVQHTSIHEKCNPDPDFEKINSIMEEMEAGESSEIGNLLKYVIFSTEDSAIPKIGTSSATEKKETIITQTYEVVSSYEEFTTVSAENLYKQKRLLTSGNVRIAEFLSVIGSRQLKDSAISIKSDEQITNIDDYEGIEDDVITTTVPRKTYKDFEKERKAVKKFLGRYSKHLLQRTKELTKQDSTHLFPDVKLTITDYSNFLIACQLMVLYAGKRFEQAAKNTNRGEVYLNLNGDKPYDNLSQFCFIIIDSFLLLMQQGDKAYKLENLNRKKAEFKEAVFFNIIFLICNLQWKKSEQNLVQLLLANATFQFFVDSSLSSNVVKGNLEKWIKDRRQQAIYVNRNFQTHIITYFNTAFKQFSNFAKSITSNKKKLLPINQFNRHHDLLYNSKLGICRVQNIKQLGNEQFRLALVRTAFSFDKKEEAYLYRQTFGKKVVIVND